MCKKFLVTQQSGPVPVENKRHHYRTFRKGQKALATLSS
jgi:hypothetical protein